MMKFHWSVAVVSTQWTAGVVAAMVAGAEAVGAMVAGATDVTATYA